jgi:hypothetical protein
MKQIAEDGRRRLSLFTADTEDNVIILLTRPMQVCYHLKNQSYAKQCLYVKYQGISFKAIKPPTLDEENERFLQIVSAGGQATRLISVLLSCFEINKTFITPEVQAPSADPKIDQNVIYLGHGQWGDVLKVKASGADVITVYRPVLTFSYK